MSNVFKCGLIADTQYVDADNGSTFDGSVIRRYRQSLSILSEAVDHFQVENVRHCVLLGDLLDSKCKTLNMAEKCLETVLRVTERHEQKWYYCVGNHDLNSLSRETFHTHLIPKFIQDRCNKNKLYYDYNPCIGFRFILLDGYEVSTISAISDIYRQQAVDTLAIKNKNIAIPNSNWFADIPYEDTKYVPYNGAVGEEQLKWLNNVLEKARLDNEKCIIFTHMALNHKACRPGGLMWNHEEVMAVIHNANRRKFCSLEDSSHSETGVVIAIIAGHDHDGGYCIDSAGIHHIIPPAPLECAEGQVAYGYLKLYSNNTSDCSIVTDGKEKNNYGEGSICMDNSTMYNSSSFDNNSLLSVEVEQSNSSNPSLDRIDYFELSWVGKTPSPLTTNSSSTWPTVMKYPPVL